MSLNIYHEARSESDKGQIVVALTTLNRVKDSRFPDTIKGVVTQKSQFSWFWDGKSDRVRDIHSWNKSIYISVLSMVLYDYMNIRNILWYHNNTVNPKWTKRLNKVIVIGNHNFYMEK